MKKLDIKPFFPHLKAIIIFIIISFAYFTPEIFENKVLMQSDVRNNEGLGRELREYSKEHGETTRWTNTTFSGMPTYQISPSYESTSNINKLLELYRLYTPTPAAYIFIMLLGFYIMLTVFGARSDISILGAIAYAFSSYFLIIIEAGHLWKVMTLAYIPPTIAGVVLAYKGKYLAGGILTSIFLCFQILSNHVQMSYYFLFVILAYVIAIFFDCYKEKQLTRFFKASGTLCVAAMIAIAINGSNLFHTWQYSKETIRGKSELTHNMDNKTHSGLDRDYIVHWSYGIGETWTLLVPNTKGGATGYLGSNEKIKNVPQQYQQAVAQQNHYWGDQPFTSGPVYAGAFIMTLFIMSLFLLKTRLKWALLGVTVLSILLAWGQNLMWFSNLFIDYMPLYNKFRTVSSILVIAEFTIPLLAILMLVEIVKNPRLIVEKKKQVYISFGLTGGFALLFALIPGLFFNFLSQQEANAFLGQAAGNPQMNEFISALEDVRMSIFRYDAWRSVFIIAVGGSLLFGFIKGKFKSSVFIALLTLLCLADLWNVDKRYLNSASFEPQKTQIAASSLFPQTAADMEILKDKDPNFRVFNTTVNTFMDATTSYYHKSVGGYHAAKLRRYQDVIEHHLMKGNMNVINMLNTKYFIIADNNKNTIAQPNPDAAGNAWFIDTLKWVKNADEEINALTDFNPRQTAFVDVRFKDLISVPAVTSDTNSYIILTSYQPNELKYKSTSSTERFAIFSEIYYPHGWEITIDGKPTSMVRADYILRGLVIPAGEHEIIFSFKPESTRITEIISYIAMAILLLASVVYVFLNFRKRKLNPANK